MCEGNIEIFILPINEPAVLRLNQLMLLRVSVTSEVTGEMSDVGVITGQR